MKKGLKLSLIAKRLSMLQDDHNQSPLVVIPSETPVQRESHKRAQVLSDDELLGEEESIAQIQSKMSKSRKRAKAVNNYESSTNTREIGDCLQSKKRGRSSLMKREEAIQAKLEAKYPSFTKLMLKSHVSGGFWLGLPSKFCDNHLPCCDTNMVLVDEDGKESYSKYLARKCGLSGGWRGFSLDHGLVEGDELTFCLISPHKFKVYIKREQNSGDVEALPLDYGTAEQNSEDRTEKIQQIKHIEEIQTSVDKLPQSNSEADLVCEVLQGLQFSDNSINFKTLNSFENFNITLDGIIIDSKFSENTRKKYYELCKSQKTVLHDNLPKGLNRNLVVGTILEVVNISNAISSCEAQGSPSYEDLKIWKRTLEGFEFLGLKVGFLRARVKQLMGLGNEESNRLKETIIRRALAKERMKVLTEKFTALTETMEKIDLEVDDEIMKASSQK